MAARDDLEIEFFRNIGILVSYRCQVACPHCIVEAGPARRETVDVSEGRDWLRQWAATGHVRVVSFTGGEPFLAGEAFFPLASYAHEVGLAVTAVTNAFWAVDGPTAKRVLSSVPGLLSVAISADEYHQRAIPLERVQHAVTAARDLGICYSITFCAADPGSDGARLIYDRLLTFADPADVNVTTAFPVGRAARNFPRSLFPSAAEPSPSACWAASSPVVLPDGRVIACIGPVVGLKDDHPLTLGNLRREPFDAVWRRAEENAVLHALRVWGPRKLVAAARAAGLASYLPADYLRDNACDACYNLMTSRRLAAFFAELNREGSFREETAYGRVYYLGETAMATRLGLGG